MRTLAIFLIAGSVAFGQGVRIDDPSVVDLNYTDVADASKIRIPTSNTQNGVPGETRDVGVDQLAKLATSRVVNVTSHGFVSGDVGKPLDDFAVYDDTDLTARADWILLQVVDANNIRIAGVGATVDLGVALLDGGNAYDVSTSGRLVYYDTSAGLYKSASGSTPDPLLAIVEVDTTTFTAVLVSQPRFARGAVTVQHADGTSQRFIPTADTDAARGTALNSALSALVKSTTAGKQGSTLVLAPGETYQIDDVTIDDKDGCRIVGNGATLTDDGTYDHIILFTNSDDLVISDLWLVGSTTDQDAPTNVERGTGLYLSECDRVTIRGVTSNWHCGLEGATGELPSNISSYGMHIQACEDILIENVTVNHNGRYGLEIRESVRITVRNAKAVNNGRAFINVANSSVNPEWLTIDGVQGYGGLSFTNPLMSGCPGITVGSGTTYAESLVTIANCDLEWKGIDLDASSLGGSYPMVKVTDYENVNMQNVNLQQGANAGDMDDFAVSFWDCSFINMVGVKTDSDIRNNSAARIGKFNMIGCVINRAQRSVSATFGFEVDRATVRGCEMWFTNSALDFSTQAGNYREVTGNIFHGAGASDYVFSSADPVNLAAGSLVVEGNELDNCSLSDTAAKILQIETGGRVSFSDGADTPAVTRGVLQYETANTTSTTITDFDSGFDGQTITVHVNDANTTIQNSVDIQLQGATDFVSGSGGAMLTFTNYGGTWFETGRATF